MCRKQCLDSCRFFVGGYDCLNTYFTFGMQLPYRSTVWGGTFPGSECPLAFHVITAQIIVADIAASGVEQGFPHVFRLGGRYKCGQLYQRIFLGFQDTDILQTDFLGNLEVHSSRCIIQVSVRSINNDVILDGFQDTTFHIIPARDGFIPFENERVM